MTQKFESDLTVALQKNDQNSIARLIGIMLGNNASPADFKQLKKAYTKLRQNVSEENASFNLLLAIIERALIVEGNTKNGIKAAQKKSLYEFDFLILNALKVPCSFSELLDLLSAEPEILRSRLVILEGEGLIEQGGMKNYYFTTHYGEHFIQLSK